MSKYVTAVLTMVITLFVTEWAVSAQVLSAVAPLRTIVAHSDLIVVGKLTRIETLPSRRPKLPKSGVITDLTQIAPLGDGYPGQICPSAGHYLNAAGKYHFQVVRTIKGARTENVVAQLPSIDSAVYNYAETEIAVGGTYLLFLAKSGDGPTSRLVPADKSEPCLPLIVLTRTTARHRVIEGRESDSPLEQIYDAILELI